MYYMTSTNNTFMIVITDNTNANVFYTKTDAANYMNMTYQTMLRWSKQAEIKLFKEYTVYFTVNTHKMQNRGGNIKEIMEKTRNGAQEWQ